MGVGRSSSLRTTTDRSPLHDVRQPASRRSKSTRYKFIYMDEHSAATAHDTAQRLRAIRLAGRSSEVWWSQTGSNRRPPACKAGALPTELWPRLQARRHSHSEIPRLKKWWA